MLKEAGFDIASGRSGCYLDSREFEDSELKLLIDGVLCSQHINPGWINCSYLRLIPPEQMSPPSTNTCYPIVGSRMMWKPSTEKTDQYPIACATILTGKIIGIFPPKRGALQTPKPSTDTCGNTLTTFNRNPSTAKKATA